MSQILIESLNFKLHMSVSFNLNSLHKFKGSDSLAYCKELRFLLLHPSEYFIRIGITVYQELGGSLHTQTWHNFFSIWSWSCSSFMPFTKGTCYCGLVDQLFLRKRVLNWMSSYARHQVGGASLWAISHNIIERQECVRSLLCLHPESCTRSLRRTRQDESQRRSSLWNAIPRLYFFPCLEKERWKREKSAISTS